MGSCKMGTFIYDNQLLVMVYLKNSNCALLAIGASQNALADAVLDKYEMFDSEDVERCLSQICNLEIESGSSTDAEAFVAHNYLADFFAGILCELLVSGNWIFPRATKVVSRFGFIVDFPKISSALLVYMGSSAKVVQFFSKQQMQLIYEDECYLNDFEMRGLLQQFFVDAPLPAESGVIPVWYDGYYAELLVLLAFCDMTRLADDGTPVTAVPLGPPWRENYINN